jgi:hypothetical protein
MTRMSHSDRDTAVRAVLTDHGDTGETPRDATFYFYGGDIKGLTAAASRAGYQTQPTVGKEGVILYTETAVDEASFETHSIRMENWAIEFDSEYDGWECQLMVQ